MALHVRRASGLLLALSVLLSVAGPTADALGAEFEIAPNGFAVAMLDAGGDPENRAGAHPDRLQIDFALNLEGSTPRDLVFELPPGFGMNAAAVPLCPRQLVEAEEECPPESRVGSFEIVLEGGGKGVLPLFELEAPPGEPVAIGTTPAFDVPVRTELRSDDFGITVRVSDLPQEAIAEGHLELWGVPADHQQGTAIPRQALLSAPPSCGPLSFGFSTRSWQDEAPWLSTTAETPLPLVDCESLDFDPRLAVGLSDPVADSPTGLRVDLSMPGEAAGDERAQAQIDDVSVTMPGGIGLSPAGAQALSACSDAQVALGDDGEARCPPSSVVGSVELSSPSLNAPLVGTVYLAEERPGQRFRVFVVAGVLGTTLKIVAALQVDPATGRLSAVLRDLPPLSIRSIALIFRGGPGALLVSPLECGPATALASFTPYGGGAPVDASATAAVAPNPPGSACGGPLPFSPRLSIALSNRRAGRPTTFTSTVRRQPGEQLPSGLSLTLPAGLSARLGAVEKCPAASVACPPSSAIGRVVAEIGSGPGTVPLRGGLHLTDAYREAPFGVLMSLRAAIGPFDLGSISLRGSAGLNPRSGRLTVSMDRLPASVEGVPVRFRSVELSMDRPGFVHNPTSCAPASAAATVESQAGAVATLTSPLDIRGCDRLGFKPALRMSLLGRSELREGGRPGLRFGVRFRPGDANLRAMRAAFPAAVDFGIGGLRALCSRRDAIEASCPAGSRVGSARARSPLLGDALAGPIYVAQPGGDGLPEMWVSLQGGGVSLNLNAKLSNRRGDVVLGLTGLPDLSLSSFAMRLAPGPGSTLTLRSGPCSGGKPRRLESRIEARGQNGARRSFRVPVGMKAPCARGAG